MLYQFLPLLSIVLASPISGKRAIANYYSQADGQITKNPTSLTGLTPLTLTVGADGSLHDQAGRTCYTVNATGQLQCSSPVITQPVTQTGFSNVNGNLAQNGNSVFYECETVGGQQSNYHIYNHNDGEICYQTTIPLSTGSSTQNVGIATTVKPVVQATTITTTLHKSTVAPAPTPAAPVSSPATSAVVTAPTTPNLYPRLIVPVVNGQGSQGSQYFVTVSSSTKTDLLFDITSSSGYKTCTLVGRFPVGGSPTSSGNYGSAQVQAELLTSNINTSTSSSNQPAGKTDLGTQSAGTATNGANAVYSSFSVVAGQSYSIALTAVSGSLSLFEDYNAPVVGYTLNCV